MDKSLSDSKNYGFWGKLEPIHEFNNLHELFEIEGITFSIKNTLFEVGYDDINLEAKAKQLTQHYIDAWIFNNNRKITIDFNHSWKLKNTGGKLHGLELGDTMRITERVIVKTMTYSIKAMARIVKPGYDSASFFSHTELAEKSLKNEALGKALEYYSQEVIDKHKPLYGIYKAIEVLVAYLSSKGDGIELLGKLAGENKKYVVEIRESTQHQRHARTLARKLLNEAECRERTKKLISAFSDSLTI